MEELTRKQKKSHDHRFTTWLKNIIFGIVMIAPFLSVMARTIYVQSNPNAKDSYYGENINEKQYENITTSQMNIGSNYYLITPTNDTYTRKEGNTGISVSNVILDNVSKDITDIRFYVNLNTTALTIQGIGPDSFIINTTQTHELQFTFNGINNSNYVDDINTILYTITYNKYSYIDNAFEYSIYQLHNVDFYNWSKNTAIYTAIDNMTNGLGMGTNNTLALLLAYWSILTAVYIVFDIIIFCFTKITHFINSD